MDRYEVPNRFGSGLFLILKRSSYLIFKKSWNCQYLGFKAAYLQYSLQSIGDESLLYNIRYSYTFEADISIPVLYPVRLEVFNSVLMFPLEIM
jgi:hypothetical protein